MTSYSTKETAAELRKHLRRVWPDVKFSVRCNRGTASAWIGVAWTDGPTYTQPRAAWSQFQGAQFNGMTDSYDLIDPKLVCTDRADLPEIRDYHCDGINGARGFSDEAVHAAARQVLTENREMATAYALVRPVGPAHCAVSRPRGRRLRRVPDAPVPRWRIPCSAQRSRYPSPPRVPFEPGRWPGYPGGVRAEQDVDMRSDRGGAVAQQGQSGRSRTRPE